MAIKIPLPTMNKYMHIMITTPTNPNSSARIEKIKSVVLSGRKSSWPWLPFSQPFPNKPPEPMAIFD